MPVTSSTTQENGLRDPDPRYHGVSGPIVKAYPTWFNPLHFTFLDTLETLGVPRNSDPVSLIGSSVASSTASHPKLSYARIAARTLVGRRPFYQ